MTSPDFYPRFIAARRAREVDDSIFQLWQIDELTYHLSQSLSLENWSDPDAKRTLMAVISTDLGKARVISVEAGPWASHLREALFLTHFIL